MKKKVSQKRNTRHQSANNKGQGLVEYALLLVLVGIAVVAIVEVMEPAIGDVFQRMVDKNVVAPPALAGYTPPPTYTLTPTIDPNITPSPTSTNTPVPTATDTPVFTYTPTETAQPADTHTPTATNTPQYLACEYVGVGGTVVIEAEKYAQQTLGNPSSSVWAANVDYAGYVGNTALMVPNVGANMSLTTNGPRLDYPVRLDVAGDYYIFVRGRPLSPDEGGNDSFHAGVDGNAITLSGTGFTGFNNGSGYNWQRWGTPVTLTEGQHTLNIWMREDGMIIDRVMLSTNSSSIGNGSTSNGPASSTAPAGCTGVSAPPPTSTPTSIPTNTPIPTATPTVNPNTVQTFERRVEDNNDDAEERVSNGNMDLGSSDLELIYDGHDQFVGIRFRDVQIPRGATIVNAYIEFRADESQSGATSLVFQGQAANNPGTFNNTSYDISSRNRTTASMNWNNVPAWNSNGTYQTPNMATVIQEIVNRGGWSSGNSMVIIISGSGHRTAESHNGNRSRAALLHIEYAVP